MTTARVGIFCSVFDIAEPVRTDRGLTILPTQTRESAKASDILVVPGGPGIDYAMLDDGWIAYARREAAKPASSCTRCDIPNCARTASMGSGRIDLPTAGRLCKRRENDVNELQGFSRGGVWLSQCRNRL